jgi:hypothetical protein
MNVHKYILQIGSKKHHCPICEQKTFVRYVDSNTGYFLPEQYGRCDREVNCAYHLNPYKDGYINMIKEQEVEDYSVNMKSGRTEIQTKPAAKSKLAFIPEEVLKQTLNDYEKNIFIQNLLNKIPFPFEVGDVEKVVSMYYLGTVSTGYMAGGVTFPFIDKNRNVRAIQVKKFANDNHTTNTDFIHSIIERKYKDKGHNLPQWLIAYNENDKKVSCLFGEHLLHKHPNNPVALVEAPKTAIYGTLYFGSPKSSKDLLWLAVYNLSSLNLNKCRALSGRDVFLFPDLSKEGVAFQKWSKKAKEIEAQLCGARFEISDFLEHRAGEMERIKGWDLADYLVKLDWREFRSPPIKETKQPITSQPSFATKICKKDSPLQLRNQKQFEPQVWPLIELEHFFKSVTIPNGSINLSEGVRIVDIPKFIDSNLEIVKAQNGKPTYRPYYERLEQLKEILLTLKN